MYVKNEQKILALLQPHDVVLDIGGWACPFNRANYVMDAEPYETRGYYRTLGPGWSSSQGGDKEFFSKETWIQRDICDHKPFPFADKEIDFVICSHTLEDIRDPLWVCSEMNRIAKRGYIEVPSRLIESCRNRVFSSSVGLSHHRWLVEMEADAISFLMKYHLIHNHWKYSFPSSFAKTLPEEKKVSWLFWEKCFYYYEETIHGEENIAVELESYIQKNHPYKAWKLKVAQLHLEASSLGNRFLCKARAMIKI